MKLELWLGILLLVAAALPPAVSAQESTNKPARALPAQLKAASSPHEPPEASPAPPPSFQGITRPMILAAPPTVELTNGVLAFDRETQESFVTNGVAEVRFAFLFTNVSPASLVITNVAISCGCLAVELPALPWVLKPGESGRLPVTLEVAGKSGVVAKTLQVRTDRGLKTLIVRANLKPPVEPAE